MIFLIEMLKVLRSEFKYYEEGEKTFCAMQRKIRSFEIKGKEIKDKKKKNVSVLQKLIF